METENRKLSSANKLPSVHVYDYSFRIGKQGNESYRVPPLPPHPPLSSLAPPPHRLPLPRTAPLPPPGLLNKLKQRAP